MKCRRAGAPHRPGMSNAHFFEAVSTCNSPRPSTGGPLAGPGPVISSSSNSSSSRSNSSSGNRYNGSHKHKNNTNTPLAQQQRAQAMSSQFNIFIEAHPAICRKRYNNAKNTDQPLKKQYRLKGWRGSLQFESYCTNANLMYTSMNTAWLTINFQWKETLPVCKETPKACLAIHMHRM